MTSRTTLLALLVALVPPAVGAIDVGFGGGSSSGRGSSGRW